MSHDDVRIMNVFKKLGWGRFLFEQRRDDESLNTWSIFARAIGRFRRSERMLNFSRITEVELSNPEQFQRGIYNLTALNLISVEEGPGPNSFLSDDDEYQQLDGVFDEIGVKTQRKYPPLYFCSPLGVSFLEATDSALRKNVLGRFSEEADQPILEAYIAGVAERKAGGPAAAEEAARIAADFEAWKRKRERSNKDGPESA
uniref:hypothetical protein n=1 Tax=Rheinheimera sp. TaxID=1869214 RepID=UPI004048D8EA